MRSILQTADETFTDGLMDVHPDFLDAIAGGWGNAEECCVSPQLTTHTSGSGAVVTVVDCYTYRPC